MKFDETIKNILYSIKKNISRLKEGEYIYFKSKGEEYEGQISDVDEKRNSIVIEHNTENLSSSERRKIGSLLLKTFKLNEIEITGRM